MKSIREKVKKELKTKSSKNHKAFIQKLVPTLEAEKIYGVKAKDLQKIIKTMTGEEKDAYLRILPHDSLEEILLIIYLINERKNLEEALSITKKILPYLETWMTIDALTLPQLVKENAKGRDFINSLFTKEPSYAWRLGLVLLIKHFSKESWKKEDMEKIHSLSWCLETYAKEKDSHATYHLKKNSLYYYLAMAIAWYMATVLTYHYEEVLPYFETAYFPKWIHNKSLQKGRESLLLSLKEKEKLSLLKQK